MKPFARDPFSLMAFHRVLIVSAVLLCLIYGTLELVRKIPVDPVGAVVRASIAFVIALGLVYYLRRLGRKATSGPTSGRSLREP